MSTTPIRLEGCRPEPMGSYLKSLGVFRLVSEQVDGNAHAWWDGNVFRLECSLDDDALVDFFLNKYSPTPIVAPWNGGSGFHEKDRKDGIDSIARDGSERFREFRDAIAAIFEMPEFRAFAESRKAAGASRKKGEWKADLVRACRNRLGDRAVDWIDAAIVLRTDGDLAYPPVLGTAGNEGRLDYTNTFMCHLRELLLNGNGHSRPLLRSALFGEVTGGLMHSPSGQHDPGRAGGYNQGPGIESSPPTNPWNFILALEGAVAWAGGVGRRQGVGLPRHAVSPFTVAASAVGYGSAAAGDESAARAEIWMPLWNRRARFPEVCFLLREGRAEIGRRPASNGLQFAEAATALGVDRGIEAFARYCLVKRRGDSFIALPAGRFPVRHLRATDLLQDLDAYLSALERNDAQQARLLAARRNIDRAVYEFLLHGSEVEFRAILEALGRLEQEWWLRGSHAEEDRRRRPRPLRPAWLLYAGDSLELRIAAALASIAARGKVPEIGQTIRSQAWAGSNLRSRLASVLQRRMLDASRVECDGNPLWGRIALKAADICAFRDGVSDDAQVETLLFGLTLVNWFHEEAGTVCEQLRKDWAGPISDWPISREWAVLKHMFLPDPIRGRQGEGKAIRPEPSVVPLLLANRVREACELAQRRLRSSGLQSVEVDFDFEIDGSRLAGALLVPLRGVDEISRLVIPEETQDRGR